MLKLRHLHLLAISIFLILPLLSNGVASKEKMPGTYYDVLGLDPKCELKDIKKAYRKLALKYHPDRVPADKKDESTIKFREVSEAYEVLSDKDQRASYDRTLRYGGGGFGGNSHSGQRHDADHRRYQEHRRQRRDPFAQFDDLFRNDPFFNEAFKNMDDVFAKAFQNNGNQNREKKQPKGWVSWLLDTLGVDVQITTSSVGPDGKISRSNFGHSSRSSTSKSTRTIIENGKRITIQSMEKDGNKIEERYENNELVQRLVNGRPQNIGRIAQGDL